MSAELAPCPFCGGIAKMGLTARVEWKDTVSVFCVHCSANVCRTGPVQSEATKRQVNEAWNLRTPPAMSADHIGEATNMVAPVEAVAWRVRRRKEDAGFGRPQVFTTDDASEADLKQWRGNGYEVQPLYTHPAPINPSGDTGELRERVAQIIGEAVNRRAPGQIVFSTLEDADAILDLIQSEKAG